MVKRSHCCCLQTIVLLAIVICLIALFSQSSPNFASISSQQQPYIDGYRIWPSPIHNTVDRTDSQIRFLNAFGPIHNASKRAINETKTIMLVGSFYFDFAEAQNTFKTCPVTDCQLLQESSGIDPKTVDVIVMFNMDRKKLVRKFLPKPKHQIWVANHWESPLHPTVDADAVGSNINWSSSYRPDSHLITPYGRFRRLSPSELTASSAPEINYAAGRTKQVAWFVSNCADKNGRRNYARELSKYIGVDIYGKCGTLHCPRSNETACFTALKRDYKFYLSFENSNCVYYMTEKLFGNAYGHDVIPIVMGAPPEDYARVLPPHSYIHVDDFESPRELANYLRRLDADDNLYNQYFRWKTEWVTTGYPYWCLLCGMLHAADAHKYVHWYPQYSRYWNGDDGSACNSQWTKRDGASWMTWRNVRVL